MPVSAIADQINDDIFAVFVTVISGQLHHMHDRFGVFAVHVKDGYH